MALCTYPKNETLVHQLVSKMSRDTLGGTLIRLLVVRMRWHMASVTPGLIQNRSLYFLYHVLKV